MGKTQDHGNSVEQRPAVGGGWRLVAVGGWLSLGAVLRGCPEGPFLTNKNMGFLRTALHCIVSWCKKEE